MKIQKDLLWTLLGTAVIAALVAFVYWSNQPEPLQLELSESVKSPEHVLVSQALNDPEAFTQATEAETTSIEKTKVLSKMVSSFALDSSSNLPRTDETCSRRAPDLDVSALGTSAQRIYLSGASLREDAFTSPESTQNLSVMRTLIRKCNESVE